MPTLLVGVLAGGLTGSLLTAPASANDLKRRQHQVFQRIGHAQNDLDASSGRVRRTAAALGRAQERLQGARTDLTGVLSDLEDAKAEDARLTAALTAAQQRLETAQADVAAGAQHVDDTRSRATSTITSIYQNAGDPQLQAISSFLTSDSLADLGLEQQAAAAMVDRRARVVGSVEVAQDGLEATAEEVQKATDEVALKQRAAERHLTVVRDLRTRSWHAKVRVKGMVDRQRAARKRAYVARRHDQRVLARLKKQEEAIRRKIMAAAARSPRGFTGSKGGFLDPPVSGPVTSPFGYRIHPIYHYYGLHDGTDFGAGCGAPLRAAAGGTVIARYYSSVYGNRLYLNVGRVNGRNLTVVYNHATGYGYGVGAHVARGAVIGRVGATGWATGCHLHFTVLENGRAVNPMNYL